MREVWVKEKNGKVNFRFKTLIVSLLFLLAGLGFSAQAAGNNVSDQTDRQSFGQIGYFDPFNLTTIYSSSSRTVVIRGPQRQPIAPAIAATPAMAMLGYPITLQDIRIPFRPALRSPFRPPLVH